MRRIMQDSNLFSHDAHSIGVWSGYMITPEIMLNVGYKEPPASMTMPQVSVGQNPIRFQRVL